MELQLSHSICPKVQATGNLWTNKARDRANTEETMRTEGDRNNRSGSMPRSYPHADKHTTEIQRILFGIGTACTLLLGLAADATLPFMLAGGAVADLPFFALPLTSIYIVAAMKGGEKKGALFFKGAFL